MDDSLLFPMTTDPFSSCGAFIQLSQLHFPFLSFVFVLSSLIYSLPLFFNFLSLLSDTDHRSLLPADMMEISEPFREHRSHFAFTQTHAVFTDESFRNADVANHSAFVSHVWYYSSLTQIGAQIGPTVCIQTTCHLFSDWLLTLLSGMRLSNHIPSL